MQPYIFKKQIFSILICIIFFLLNLHKNSYNLTIIIGSLLLILISITFLPLIRYKLPYPLLLHYVLYNLPFILPIYFIKDTFHLSFSFRLVFFSIIIGFILYSSTLIYKRKNKEYHHNFIVQTSLYEHVLTIFYLTLSVISEELFFRQFLITITKKLNFNFLIIILGSSFLFVLMHFLNRWANVTFNVIIYTYQLILSLVLATFYYFTDFLIGCFIIHFIFNLDDFKNEFQMMTHRVSNNDFFSSN